MLLSSIVGQRTLFFSAWNTIISWYFFSGVEKKKMSYTDKQLILFVLDGKKEFFEIIVDRRGQKLFRYLYHYFAFDQHTAEDAFQEVFIHVWKHLDKYDHTQTFSTWLYTVARNKTLDRIRANKGEKTLQILDQLDLIDEEERYSKNKQRKRSIIQRVLEQLKPLYKEVIILHYFEEYTYDEIATIVGSNKNSVGTLLHRAKKELKLLIASDILLSDALEIDV